LRILPGSEKQVGSGRTFDNIPLKVTWFFKRWFEKWPGALMGPSEITQERILKTAARLFADRGYEATSIRTIATKAGVNQAAINYHFKSKDGLYLEVLRRALRGLTEHQLSHAQETRAMPREQALGEFIRQQLRPLSARDEVSRYIHLFYWETVRPTAVYRKLVSEEATPFIGFAVDLMRRFMPEADQRTLIVAAVWLMGQCTVFVRHREELANPPVLLASDEATIEWLTAHISAWALAGLAHAKAGSSSALN
jgi:TetR/AcrR family transcriptional regulator, regulator of cefoperazone and chloramphenicol sensitivity